MFMEKQMFFLEKKNINLWQSEFDSVCFLAFFLFLLLLYVSFYFSSSFKVNLKVHYRNWCVILLLAPMKNKSAGQKQSAPVSLRNKTTSKQF